MDALAYDLKQMCRSNRDGSHATQANRKRMLQGMARELKAAGYALASARSLKPKHIDLLTSNWNAGGLSKGRMKNLMGAVRWWAAKVNKASVVARTNEAYGIGSREAPQARGKALDREKLSQIQDERVAASLELQAAFGLRKEEAIKFMPVLGDKGDHLSLKPAWTKGGRYREIPITHPKQREILDRVAELAGDGSLIPDDRNYIQQAWVYDKQTLDAGLNNNHGLRHGWAQWRYQQMTGWTCPAKGGKSPEQMTHREFAIDRDARRELAQELGHNRIDITKIYLGG